MMHRLKAAAPWLLLALILSVTLTAASHLPPLKGLEKRLLDLSFKIRGEEPVHPDIVIVAVTDESLKQIRSWPWPRKFHATLLNILRPYQPAVIMFDMIFSEKSDTANDAALAEAIQKSGNILLSYYFAGSNLQEIQRKSPEGLPIQAFRDKALGMGYTNIFPDEDGHVREIVLRHEYEGQSYLHISLTAAAAAKKWTEAKLRSFKADYNYLMNFPGPYDKFTIVPYERLIWNSQFAWYRPFLESLRGKVILIGHTATGTAMDLKPTAFSSAYPGVGLLASMLHTILTERLITKLPVTLHGLLLFIFLTLVITVNFMEKPLRAWLHQGSYIILVFLISQFVFKYFRIWIPTASFILGLLFLQMLMTLFFFVQIHFEKEMMSRELSLAARIQQSLMPAQMPQLAKLSLAALSIPARHVGGDLYDWMQLGESSYGICIGDVSGKGVPAALFMSRTVTELRREAREESPSVILKNLNQKLSEGGFTGLFVTVLFLIADYSKGVVRYANGGHEPIFFYQKKNHKITRLHTESGGPLGIDAESVFDEKEVSVEPGDIMLLDSDGVKEAMNSKREIFGFDRIEQAILECADQTPEEILLHVKKRVDEFVKSAPQHDDLTLVCLKFL